jgi:hypothetical protein
MDKPAPLTDEQIRTAFLNQIERMMHLRMDLLVLRRALVNKGLLTEADIAEAHLQLEAESKETTARVENASRQEPSGGVQ